MILPLITLAIFALGFWSARVRIKQLNGETLPLFTKITLGLVGLLCAVVAAGLITTPGLPVVMAEFFTLCFGQTVGYLLTRSKKNN